MALNFLSRGGVEYAYDHIPNDIAHLKSVVYRIIISTTPYYIHFTHILCSIIIINTNCTPSQIYITLHTIYFEIKVRKLLFVWMEIQANECRKQNCIHIWITRFLLLQFGVNKDTRVLQCFAQLRVKRLELCGFQCNSESILCRETVRNVYVWICLLEFTHFSHCQIKSTDDLDMSTNIFPRELSILSYDTTFLYLFFHSKFRYFNSIELIITHQITPIFVIRINVISQKMKNIRKFKSIFSTSDKTDEYTTKPSISLSNQRNAIGIQNCD